MSNDDEWKFKVNQEDLEGPKEEVKATNKAKLLRERNLHSQKKQQLEVAYEDLPERRSRSALAKREVALENYKEMAPAPHGRRIGALLVDILFTSVLWYGAGYGVAPLLKEYLLYLEKNGISQMLDPKILNLYIQLLIYTVLFLVLYLLPAMSSRKTPGKRVFKLWIGHVEEDRASSALQVLFRELIAKPVSMALIVGYIIPFFNKKHRSLHDFICGTTVYLED